MTNRALRSPQNDLAQRRPVWEALSILFLDTELTAIDFAYAAKTLAASPYTDAELAAIYHAEVEPVCRSNIGWAPGYWAGFPDGWIEQAVLERGLDATRAPADVQDAHGYTTWGWGGLQQRVALLRRLSIEQPAPADS